MVVTAYTNSRAVHAREGINLSSRSHGPVKTKDQCADCQTPASHVPGNQI